MKGAIAEPWESTRSSPNKTRKRMMGRSHHFFLALRKCQNSKAILSLDMMCSHLKLMFIIGRFLCLRVPLAPIALPVLLEIQIKQVLPREARQDSDGCDHTIEEDKKNDAAHDPAHENA